MLASLWIHLEISSMILALECGALKKQDAINWADQIILESSEPDVRLFDISVAQDNYEIVSLLNQFEQHEKLNEIGARAFTFFAKGLQDNKTTYERVARKLYDIAFSGYAPYPQIESQMMCYWDELADTNLGIYGNSDEIKRSVCSFLLNTEANKAIKCGLKGSNMASVIAEYQRFLEVLAVRPIDNDIRRMANLIYLNLPHLAQVGAARRARSSRLAPIAINQLV